MNNIIENISNLKKFTAFYSYAGFEGQHYRKLEHMKFRPRIKMKSKSLTEAKAECYLNPKCDMILEYRLLKDTRSKHGHKKNKFYFCSIQNASLERSDSWIFSRSSDYKYNDVTYIKGNVIIIRKCVLP